MNNSNWPITKIDFPIFTAIKPPLSNDRSWDHPLASLMIAC